MRLSFRIALRFLSSSKGQTLLIALGIAIGISVQIFIGSLIDGLQKSLLDATIGRSSQITVTAPDKKDPLEQYARLEALLIQRFPDITAISPSISNGAFLRLDDRTEQIVFRGFERTKANEIYKLDEALVSGRLNFKDEEILIGTELALENNIRIGDWVDLVTPKGKVHPLNVIGFFDLKVSSLNKTWIIGDLSLGKHLFDYDSWQASNLEIQVAKPFEADTLTYKMKTATLKYPTKITNWKFENVQLLNGLKGQSSSSLIIQVFVVISVVLGIASVLAITVLQKSKQLGILKAMGLNDRQSSLVFLFQGFILGVLGGALGIGLGLGLLWSFSKFAITAEGTPVVPVYINLNFIVLSGLIAVGASTLAAIMPAVKSRALSPIEVIKNG